MVSAKFVGRLGNIMFIKACVIGYSIKHNMPYTFDQNLNFPIYKEPCFEYREIPYFESICLSGYFQSEKYFSHCKQEIIDYFNFPKERINRISIHVRRGDYLDVECHPVITLDYINKAVNHFKELGYKDDDFLVFTDDKKWCRDNLPYEVNEGTEEEDIKKMSQCEYNIISNSSFSWWGAWLNQNPNKIVIAPKKWFAGSKENINTNDLYCKEWLIM